MKIFATIVLFATIQALALDPSALKAAGSKALEKGKDIAAACKTEQVEFCKDAKMDAIKECLTKNKEKLSPTCKSSIGL